MRTEQEQFKFDDSLPFLFHDDGDKNIGGMVVINAPVNRCRYRHSAYRLCWWTADTLPKEGAAEGQAGYSGLRLGGQRTQMGKVRSMPVEIKPEKNARLGEEALSKSGTGKKENQESEGGTLMEIRALTQPEQKYTYAQSMQRGQTGCIGHLRGDFAPSGYGFIPLGF